MPGAQPRVPGGVCCVRKTLTLAHTGLLGTSAATVPSQPHRVPKPGHCGGGVGPSNPGGPPCWATPGRRGLDSPCPLLSFQVTSASLEASTAVHPPSREPGPRPGAPTESLTRGSRTAPEQGPARGQQSSLDTAGADLVGTGRPAFYCLVCGADQATPARGAPKASCAEESHLPTPHPRQSREVESPFSECFSRSRD